MPGEKVIRTWHLEMVVVGLVLTTVVLLTGGGLVEWVGSLAVLLAFGHTQIADRLAEREATRTVVMVECHHRLVWYLVSKEALWALYFVLRRSWAALVGVGVFLLYPVWRKLWRKRKPLIST